MKNIIRIGAILTVLSLSACASAPNPWSGIPYDEREQWQAIGVEVQSARTLRSNGFTPFDTKEWIQQGVSEPNAILSWKRAGFSASQTSKWLSKGFTLNEAVELAR
jgi:type II secretory pathway component PulF